MSYHVKHKKSSVNLFTGLFLWREREPIRTLKWDIGSY